MAGPSWTPTFGVEFEFVLAAIVDPEQPNPNPADPRQVYFTTIPEDFRSLNLTDDGLATSDTIYRHVRETLRKAGFPTGPGALKDNTVWEVTRDNSIRGPGDIVYHYFGLEITTPALDFTEESFTAIETFCRVIQETYVVSVNNSCGLHVHMGNGKVGFDLSHLRRFAAFAYAFEPQLMTLHTPPRVSNTFCPSFRRHTNYEMEFRQAQGRRPRVLEAVHHWLMYTDKQELCRAATTDDGRLVYSLERILQACIFPPDHYHAQVATTEFRQHEGTLDSAAVLNWVKTVGGILIWLKDADLVALTQLLSIADPTKMRLMETENGRLAPVQVDADFSVIDLLNMLEIFGPAAYYDKRGLSNHSDAPVSDSNNSQQGTTETTTTETSSEDSSGDGDDNGGDEAQAEQGPSPEEEETRSSSPFISETSNYDNDDAPEGPPGEIDDGNSHNAPETSGYSPIQENPFDASARSPELSYANPFAAPEDQGNQGESGPAPDLPTGQPQVYRTYRPNRSSQETVRPRSASLSEFPMRENVVPQHAFVPYRPGGPPAQEEQGKPSSSTSSPTSSQKQRDLEARATQPRLPTRFPGNPRRASDELNRLGANAHARFNPALDPNSSQPNPLDRYCISILDERRGRTNRHLIHINRAPDVEINLWTGERHPLPNYTITAPPNRMNPHRDPHPGPIRRLPVDPHWNHRQLALEDALQSSIHDEPFDEQGSPNFEMRGQALEYMMAGHGQDFVENLRPELARYMLAYWNDYDVPPRNGWPWGARVSPNRSTLQERVEEWERREDRLWRARFRDGLNDALEMHHPELERVTAIEGVRNPFAVPEGARTQHPVVEDVSPGEGRAPSPPRAEFSFEPGQDQI